MSITPATVEVIPEVASSFGRLCAGLRAGQAASPTARAADEMVRAHRQPKGLAFLNGVDPSHTERLACGRGRFHGLMSAAHGKRK